MIERLLFMGRFLEHVAKDLLARYGDAISDYIFVFPNSRTRIFFLDELSEAIDHPYWQPHHTTVDELFGRICGLGHVERLRAVVELYKCYSLYHKEEFSSFYYWGEMLLTDFDTIDKQLIDAEALFTNLNDLKNIDARLSYLTAEQIAVIKRFWASFDERAALSEQKERFLTIWQTLLPIYQELRRRLMAEGVAYTGLMQRRAVEILRDGGELPDAEKNHYVVVGFNALSETEKELFGWLKRNSEIDFYWDYDNYFLHDERQEAGLFVRENLRRFPPPIGFDPSCEFLHPKDIEAVAAASNSLQCKYVGDLLSTLAREGIPLDKRTAIVLADESLLVPLLYALPDAAEKANITMGYPLRQSLAYSFTERLLNLQKRKRVGRKGLSFYHSDVTGLLSHPFLLTLDHDRVADLYRNVINRGRIYVGAEELCEGGGVTAEIFTSCESWPELSEWLCRVLSSVDSQLMAALPAEDGKRRETLLQREYFVRITDALTRLKNSLIGCEVEIDMQVFSSLTRRMLQSLSVPFKGEPLEGLQIMGVPETRNLDFENVVMLSMNDDIFPASRSASSSFIPYNLRYAYGLPTPQYQEGVYAYYFYRLLSRAHTVRLVYCSRSDESSSGEQSRYIYQLDYESPHKIVHSEIAVDVNVVPPEPIVVEKNERVMARLRTYLSGGERKFSPSSFNLYLECPLKFYFRYVAAISELDEISEEVDDPMFGSILHKAMQLLYEPLVDLHNPAKAIAAITSEQVMAAVDEAIRVEYLSGEELDVEEYGGQLLMSREAVHRYIYANVLPYDAARSGYTIRLLEEPVECDFLFRCGEEQLSVRFGGTMDRMDMRDDGMLQIIDYKSGSVHRDFSGMVDLFAELPRKRSGAVVQTFIYSMIVSRLQEAGRVGGSDVCPSLYYVKEMRGDDFSIFLNDNSNRSEVECYSDYREELESALAVKLAELYTPSIPFRQRMGDEHLCDYCDFRQICRR